MSETWWHARGGNRIEPVQVEKHTEQSVWIEGRRRVRLSIGRFDLEGYFPSWAEARDALLKYAEANVVNLRRQLDLANGRVGNLKGLKEPQSP